MNKVLFSSNSVEWTTPLDLFNDLNNEFNFDVDLCADDHNHLLPIYFTRENSCLDVDLFNHNIFCNPPYSRGLYPFIKKCYDLSYFNNVVLLLPVRTDTKWFHDFIYNKSEIRFLKGRLHFGGSSSSAPFPSMIVIFRKKY